MARIRGNPALARLSAALEDQSHAIFADISWVARKLIINLGGLSIATHLRDLGFGKVDAFYPSMRGVRLEAAYDLLGLSCNEVTLANCIERLPELRRRFGDQPLILVGGAGMEHWWEFLLKAGADGVVIGDGQYPLTDLLGLLMPRLEGGMTLRGAYLAACSAGELAGVRDLAFVDAGGSPTRNPHQGMVRDLDEYSPVDYSLIRGYQAGHIKCVHYSSGCVFACEFCSSIVNQRHSYRQVSVQRLLDDMESAQRQGYTVLQLASDLQFPGNLSHNRRHLEELRQGRKKRGITIPAASMTTVTSLHDLVFNNTGTPEAPCFEENLDGIRLLQEAGMTMWGLGVEALSDDERARLGKDPRQAGTNSERLMRTLCRHGFSIHAMMMIHEDTTPARAKEIGRILADIGVETAQFLHPIPAPQTPWGAKVFQRDDFLIGTVGGEAQGGSRATGEYVVAAKRPVNAILAVETTYESFTSAGSVIRDVARGRFKNAGLKAGLRALILSRRYLVPQYYNYTIPILEGNYKYYKPGDAKWPGTALRSLGGLRLNFRMFSLLRRARREQQMHLPSGASVDVSGATAKAKAGSSQANTGTSAEV